MPMWGCGMVRQPVPRRDTGATTLSYPLPPGRTAWARGPKGRRSMGYHAGTSILSFGYLASNAKHRIQ